MWHSLPDVEDFRYRARTTYRRTIPAVQVPRSVRAVQLAPVSRRQALIALVSRHPQALVRLHRYRHPVAQVFRLAPVHPLVQVQASVRPFRLRQAYHRAPVLVPAVLFLRPSALRLLFRLRQALVFRLAHLLRFRHQRQLAPVVRLALASARRRLSVPVARHHLRLAQAPAYHQALALAPVVRHRFQSARRQVSAPVPASAYRFRLRHRFRRPVPQASVFRLRLPFLQAVAQAQVSVPVPASAPAQAHPQGLCRCHWYFSAA